MDFNEEGDEKGFNLVTMEKRAPLIEFIETPARQFQTLSPEFFAQPDWISMVEPRTIYRIKGEVTKDEYEALKKHLKAFPVPILNKLTVKRDIRVRDDKMTEDIKEDEALIGIISNALWLTAPDLTSAYEYEAFRKAYAQGHFVAIILYKIKKSDLDSCPDEGRVDVDEFKDSPELYKEFLGIRR